MPTPISLFLSGAAIGLTAGATPGILQTYMIAETLSGGWRRGLPLIFVPLLSDTPVIILTTFILRKLPPVAIQGISIVGGLFALYLAWGLWQQWQKTGKNESPAASQLPSQNFWKAVTVNLLNPNPYLFWTFVLGPILLSAIEQSWGHALAFLMGFYGVFLGTMVVLIALFHLTRRFGPRVIQTIQLASILILVIFGGLLLKDGIFG
ncbi:MAG TPA: hypothetical protein DEH25_10905 [Chloroflexi bacterium]|nr:hypothetical protein [Chloroflexota bacterium]